MEDISHLESSPPIEQGPLVDEVARTRWPTVIGVISLIYGILGMTCATLQVGWLGAMDVIPEMWRGGITMPLGLRLAFIGLVLPVMVLGIMLITGAVGLLRRKRSSVGLLKKWAILRIVMIVIGLVVTIVTAPAQIEMQRQAYDFQVRMLAEANRSAPPPRSEQQMWFWLIAQTGVASVIIACYPLFVGFFLSRRKINDEVAEWR
jgi:hypothetical protein